MFDADLVAARVEAMNNLFRRHDEELNKVGRCNLSVARNLNDAAQDIKRALQRDGVKLHCDRGVFSAVDPS